MSALRERGQAVMTVRVEVESSHGERFAVEFAATVDVGVADFKQAKVEPRVEQAVGLATRRLGEMVIGACK